MKKYSVILCMFVLLFLIAAKTQDTSFEIARDSIRRQAPKSTPETSKSIIMSALYIQGYHVLYNLYETYPDSKAWTFNIESTKAMPKSEWWKFVRTCVYVIGEFTALTKWRSQYLWISVDDGNEADFWQIFTKHCRVAAKLIDEGKEADTYIQKHLEK